MDANIANNSTINIHNGINDKISPIKDITRFGNLTMIYIIVFFGIMIAGAVIVYKIKRR